MIEFKLLNDVDDDDVDTCAACFTGRLYNHVAPRTSALPTTKLFSTSNSNSTTLAQLEITILKLVAKPFNMLSEYLMTTAVMSPPKTCIKTVAYAQGVKFANRLENQPGLGGDNESRLGV